MTAGTLLAWVGAIALSIVIIVVALALVVSVLRNLRRQSHHSTRSTDIMKGPER